MQTTFVFQDEYERQSGRNAVESDKQTRKESWKVHRGFSPTLCCTSTLDHSVIEEEEYKIKGFRQRTNESSTLYQVCNPSIVTFPTQGTKSYTYGYPSFDSYHYSIL
jgi:hypothetical protein